MELARRQIRIRGVVQGVGFRPFVYNLAGRLGLAGYVLNSSAGVVTEAEGAPGVLDCFMESLRTEAPPLARIEELLVADMHPTGERGFVIRESAAQEGEFVLVSPDVATCPDCYRDFTDPANRRYGYEFTNCTNCGPRYTIIRDIPYDRPNTTMAGFRMCAACQAEYDDPANRRFHAQPNACATCGPRVSEPLEEARRRLAEGQILAIRGLGGFHLACDPRNDESVRRLRERKRRSDKPFALMARDLAAVEALCDVSDDDRRALLSSRRPIVILPRRMDAGISKAQRGAYPAPPYRTGTPQLPAARGAPFCASSSEAQRGAYPAPPYGTGTPQLPAARGTPFCASSSEAQRGAYPAPPYGTGTPQLPAARGTPFCASSSEAQRGAYPAPPYGTGTPQLPAARGAPFCASSSEAQRGAYPAPPYGTGTPQLPAARGAPFCASSSEAQRGAYPAPPYGTGTPQLPAARGAPFCASSSEAQRGAYPAPPYGTGTPQLPAARGAPFCASSSEAQRGAYPAPPYGTGTPQLPAARGAPFCASSLDDVAPGNQTIGVMLPYTPLHHLLFAGAPYDVLVMTSGNHSEEPIVTGNAEALDRLRPLADWFLLHNREIYMRADDSVVRTFEGRERVLRRSRGFVPQAIDLGMEVAEILACGAELKNTFCLSKGHYALLSQHIGDMENYETMVFFEETLANLKKLFRVEPRAVAHDMHPGYLSTQYALRMPVPEKIAVQHHHAHIASCMAENGLRGKVIGVALDGTGYGTDGKIWGGEFLVADYAGFERRAHLRYVPLAGGDAAVRQPWRPALAYLADTFGPAAEFPELAIWREVPENHRKLVRSMMAHGGYTIQTSSCGRLFDAVASLVGLRQQVNFEGQAAIELEMIAADGVTDRYPYELDGDTVDFRPAIERIVAEVRGGTPTALIAARFHNTLAAVIVEICRRLRAEEKLNRVCLSGGTFQNMKLLERTLSGLRQHHFETFLHAQTPPNDGGIALGQAVVATEILLRR